MTWFDYLETRFTEANNSMATKNPNDVTVWRQAKVNATLNTVGISRKFLQLVYTVYLFINYLGIKLRIVKAPAFLSSIPQPQPKQQQPNLSVVPSEQGTPNPSGTDSAA